MSRHDEPIVLLVEARDSFEAERLRQVLESEGIRVSIAAATNGLVTGITGQIGVGGTRVMVLERDYERASLIRDDFADFTPDAPITESYVSRRTKGLFKSLVAAIKGR